MGKAEIQLLDHGLEYGFLEGISTYITENRKTSSVEGSMVWSRRFLIKFEYCENTLIKL